ncbi:hypothetical protein [Sulfurimonas sp.]|jgi:hypothetical protein|uniref:hypothetical protein n=1 Tax=Sulfurimonas sp. TaxID=2022749 RepID=UPI0025D12B7B|nr:hypothetical protein [Sulfurimonas sp.]MBT5935711.1 hypothetical protein [Sulfurimonas sp.]
MHTLTVNIQDSVFQEFLNFVSKRKEKIEITKDKNLEYDSYFYERKQELQKDIDDIDNGKIKMINNEDFWDEIDSFTESLQK